MPSIGGVGGRSKCSRRSSPPFPQVLTEAEARTPEGRNRISELGPKPALGLNCVGGKSGVTVARALTRGGIMVTYGGMSKQPVTIGTGSLIFDDLRLVGFWMTRWNAEQVRPLFRLRTKNNPVSLHFKLRPAPGVRVSGHSIADPDCNACSVVRDVTYGPTITLSLSHVGCVKR